MRNGGVRTFLPTEAHGEWGSLIAFDLRHCGNPLHRHHRLAAFDTSAETYVHLGWVRTTFELAKHAITTVYDAYGADVRPGFDRCLTTMDEARRAAR